jgi:alkaline phosphatase
VIAAEAFVSDVSGEDYAPLNFRRFPATGLVSTYATNRFITGSAAAGTALATGEKTDINRISRDTSGAIPLESIAEKAKAKGMKVGIISSVSIDHATPAVFYAKQQSRSMNFEIGLDLTQSDLDFFGGGGFSVEEGELDGKNVNLYDLAVQNDFHYINSKQGFNELRPSDKKVLFVNPELGGGASMLYAIDQDDDYIDLAGITAGAINYLDNANGFFMMVEGGKIDWASHANDLATVVYEVLDFAAAIDEAIKFYHQHPNETLIVVTADHETGGLSLGNRAMGYGTDYGILANQKVSGEAFSSLMQDGQNESGEGEAGFKEAMQLIEEYFGLGGELAPYTLTAEEIEEYRALFFEAGKGSPGDYSHYRQLTKKSTAILTRQAGAGWTSSTHTAVAVPVYALGVKHTSFSGSLDNTDISKIIWESIQ